MSNPRVTCNDQGEITVTLAGKELRGWSYKDDAERRMKMLAAREYVEGWCEFRDRVKGQVDSRLNNYLCEMKPDYDDSMTGFNEAWDIVRALFAEYAPLTSAHRNEDDK